MYQSFGDVALRSGEVVEAGVIIGPDAQWRERMLTLLAHKPPVWQWQMEQFLAEDLGIEARMHVLHRDGVLFSHILTVEHSGVGILGHVWTVPEDRGQSAARLLMGAQIADFQGRGGKALYLGTGFESSPYRIYAGHGFASIEPGSGVMAWYDGGEQQFENQWFSAADVEIVPLNWKHYATASALFAANIPGVVRNASLGLFGRQITEGPLLRALKESADNPDRVPRIWVLQTPGEKVVGLASWSDHALWPNSAIVDIYCHPNYWHKAGELLSKLEIPEDKRIATYIDNDLEPRKAVLKAAGYTEVACLPQWVKEDVAGSGFIDVAAFQR